MIAVLISNRRVEKPAPVYSPPVVRRCFALPPTPILTAVRTQAAGRHWIADGG
jgi:hypothetical protein